VRLFSRHNAQSLGGRAAELFEARGCAIDGIAT
jgi:hypothetical protein